MRETRYMCIFLKFDSVLMVPLFSLSLYLSCARWLFVLTAVTAKAIGQHGGEALVASLISNLNHRAARTFSIARILFNLVRVNSEIAKHVLKKVIGTTYNQSALS